MTNALYVLLYTTFFWPMHCMSLFYIRRSFDQCIVCPYSIYYVLLTNALYVLLYTTLFWPNALYVLLYTTFFWPKHCMSFYIRRSFDKMHFMSFFYKRMLVTPLVPSHLSTKERTIPPLKTERKLIPRV
jgi:hypothetical protein